MSNQQQIRRVTQAAMIAALSYIGFQFLRIDIPVGAERTAFHLGNVFVVLGALLLGGPLGGLSGALGLTIADLTGGYVTSAPKTFVLKLIMGLITGLVYKTLFRMDQNSDPKKQTLMAGVSAVCSLGANVVLDPLLGYYYKTYLLGVPQELSAALSKMGTLTTFVNAVLGVVCVTVFWAALYPALNKAGLLTGRGE